MVKSVMSWRCNVFKEAHTDNNVKEAVNSLKERDMVVEETNQVAVPTSKPPLPPGQYYDIMWHHMTS